jgi:hypothetical protein
VSTHCPSSLLPALCKEFKGTSSEHILLCVFCIRAEHILRLVNQQQPVLSSAEKKLMQDMNEFKDKLKGYQKALEQVKAKQNYHKIQVHDITSVSVYISDL